MEAVNDVKTETPMGILFVDDEKNVLQSLRRLFMDHEYEITLANSGEEALEVLKSNTEIGLIVSDQRMPGLSGVDFLEKAKELLPDAVRILLTGYADINAVADAINRGGAYRYITKPWDDDDLVQVIQDAANRFSLVKENKRLQVVIEKKNDELERWNAQLEYYVQEQTLEIQKKNTELEKLNSDLKHDFMDTIASFSSLIELRDKIMCNHSKYVAALSVKIADAMGLSGDEIEDMKIAALIHDIGMIGISDATLAKGHLTMEKERKKEFLQHPVRGQAAIDTVEGLRPAGILIRHHHENYDGSGFPDSLKKKEIPLGARIISIADYIEIMINSSGSKEAIEDLIAHIKSECGKRFDPDIFPHIEKPMRELYDRGTMKDNLVEKELLVEDIDIGMTLSRNVESGTGLILLSKDTVLDGKSIVSLKRYYALDPSKTGVFVWVER